MIKGHYRLVVLLAAAPILLAGCAATSAGTKQSATAPRSSSQMSMAPGTKMPKGMTMSESAAELADAGPSESAKMICSSETRRNIALLLGLSAPPHSVSTWKDHVYACTYHLPEGPLVLSVTQSGNTAAAHTYFETLRRRTEAAHPLRGLASLGLPAFERADGMVAFVKDAMTLQVDATRLPARVGAKQSTRTGLAYALATDILACWNGS